jgi:hypothetical protein
MGYKFLDGIRRTLDDVRVRSIFAARLVAVTLVACNEKKRDFPPLGPVTTANLWISASDGSKYLWKISDPNDFSRIAAFVDSRRTTWGTPWLGVPVSTVDVQFFDGEKRKGSFGVGREVSETQREGGFFSKNASLSEIRRFFDVLNLDDAKLKEFTK